MRTPRNSRSISLILLITGTVIAVGASSALAYPTPGARPENSNRQVMQLNPDDGKAREQFLEQTVSLRKEMIQKQTELQALMRGDNPNPKEAYRLAGELFDLKEILRVKARESGLRGLPQVGMTGNRWDGERTGYKSRQRR